MNSPRRRAENEGARKHSPRPRVGLALSGGGARGLAHIGVLQVLEREGVPIDLLTGTSMGGVIAAAYAAGLSADFLEQEALRMTKPRRLLSLVDLTLPERGFFEGRKIIDYLDEQLGECAFDDLEHPLKLIAVDLNSSQAVELSQGRVTGAVRATIALPGLFKPVERDEQLLVDGGLLNNLPADVVRQMGADLVIAVDVIADSTTFSLMIQGLQKRRYIPGGLASTLEVMLRSLDIMMAEINQRCLAEAAPEIVIRPDVPPDISVLTGFSRSEKAIAAGKAAAAETSARIHELLNAA